MSESKIYLITISIFHEDDTDFYAYPFTDKALAREAFDKLIEKGYHSGLNKERTHAYDDLRYETQLEEVENNPVDEFVKNW